MKWLELLTRCWLELGRTADAERAAAGAEAHAAAYGLGMATAMARRARAAVLFDAGDAVAAAELALGSAEAGRRRGSSRRGGTFANVAGRAGESGRPRPSRGRARESGDCLRVLRI